MRRAASVLQSIRELTATAKQFDAKKLPTLFLIPSPRNFSSTDSFLVTIKKMLHEINQKIAEAERLPAGIRESRLRALAIEYQSVISAKGKFLNNSDFRHTNFSVQQRSHDCYYCAYITSLFS